MAEQIMVQPAVPGVSDVKFSGRQRTLWRDAVRRFRRNRLAMLGLIIVTAFVLTAILADVLAPYPYDKPFFDKVLQLPFRDPAHILGNDEVGRDFLSRLIYGARTSITVGLAVQFIAFSIGIPLGALAGYRGGAIDFVVMRLVDIMTAFPGLLFAIFLITVWGGGMWKVILVLGFTSWLGPTRLVRAQFLSLREKEFVESARCIGAHERDILFRHILPNTLAPLLVALSFGIPGAIFGEAGLSFLGIGINDPLPSWGKMVGVSGSYIRVYWHVGLFPTVLIALTMLGFSFIRSACASTLCCATWAKSRSPSSSNFPGLATNQRIRVPDERPGSLIRPSLADRVFAGPIGPQQKGLDNPPEAWYTRAP